MPSSFKQELENCSLVTVICNTFSCKKQLSLRTPTELPKHIHFRLHSDDPVCAKIPSSFPDFDLKSTYVS